MNAIPTGRLIGAAASRKNLADTRAKIERRNQLAAAVRYMARPDKLFPNAPKTIVLYQGSAKDDDPYETLEYDERTQTWTDNAGDTLRTPEISGIIAEWVGE